MYGRSYSRQYLPISSLSGKQHQHVHTAAAAAQQAQPSRWENAQNTCPRFTSRKHALQQTQHTDTAHPPTAATRGKRVTARGGGVLSLTAGWSGTRGTTESPKRARSVSFVSRVQYIWLDKNDESHTTPRTSNYNVRRWKCVGLIGSLVPPGEDNTALPAPR